MDFIVINNLELSALRDLPYIQRIAYIFGVRPYMDKHSSIVGVKRRISYQSLSEALYVEPHPGIQSGSPSKAQLRRALKGLERAGLISIQSVEKQLILKCLLAGKDNFVQNKAVTKPSHDPGTKRSHSDTTNKGLSTVEEKKSGIRNPQEADIPLSNNNYLYLLAKFDKFWETYPVKKSKQRAWAVFEELNPDEGLLKLITQGLNKQITHHKKQIAQGEWVPPWKYPANWLMQRTWEDEVNDHSVEERSHASSQKNYKRTTVKDPFYEACKDGDDTRETSNNVIKLQFCESS